MTLYKLKLTAIIIGISAISMPVFAGFDTIIQRVGDSLKPKESFENLQKGFIFGNIYTNAHKIAEKEFFATTAQAINNMKDDLNYSYNCNLDINQVGNILLTVGYARNDIQAMVRSINEATPKLAQDSFIGSCYQLIKCVTKSKIKNADVYEKSGNLTEAGFNQCKNLASNAYDRNISKAKSLVNLASTNAGSDIYYNGTLDDSPYDILVDIQRIGDILFTTNEQSEKVLFYTFPNNSIAGFQAIPFNNDSRVTPFAASTNIGQNRNQVGGSTNIAGNNITNNNTTFPSANTNGGNTSTPTNPGGYNNTMPIYVDTTDTTTNGGVIDDYSCITPTGGGDGTIIPIIAGNTGSNQTGNTSGNGTNNNTNTYIPPVFDINTPYYSPIVGNSDDPVGNSDNREDPEQYEQQAAQIASCTAKCDGLKAIDKSMCLAKCMCGTTYTKNGMFGISICTIPTKQTDIVSSKSVQSIEEIVSEINNVLTNLKNSGEMMKHTKPTEFLDTSLSKIKLSKIFAFDVSMSFKPIIDIKPRKMTDAQAENETDQLLKGTYGSIDIGAEKNKYAIIRNGMEGISDQNNIESLEEIKNIVNKNNAEINAKYTGINESLTNSIAKSQNAEVADIVRQFLEQNVRFRTFVKDSLTQTQGTADAIRKKIEKGGSK